MDFLTMGASQEMSDLVSDERSALTLTLSRWEREQPLEASGITEWPSSQCHHRL
jgi:hypothetical protein